MIGQVWLRLTAEASSQSPGAVCSSDGAERSGDLLNLLGLVEKIKEDRRRVVVVCILPRSDGETVMDCIEDQILESDAVLALTEIVTGNGSGRVGIMEVSVDVDPLIEEVLHGHSLGAMQSDVDSLGIGHAGFLLLIQLDILAHP